MVGLSAAQLAPMKLYAGDRITYHSQMYVAGDPRGSRTVVVTRVDDSPDEADAPIKVSTDEIIPATMMIKKVFNRDGEEVTCYWRKLRTYALVPGEFEAPSDRARFAASVQNIITDAFTDLHRTGPAMETKVAPGTMERASDGDPATLMTSSVSTTAALTVVCGNSNAHEPDREDAYEEKAPVPTATTNAKEQREVKKPAVYKLASTPRGRLAAPAAPPKARSTPTQGHPSEGTSERVDRKPPSKKATKQKTSGVNSAVTRVRDSGCEVVVEDAHVQSEETTEENESDVPDQDEEASQPTPSQLAVLHEILAVPTLAQLEAKHHRRKVSKVDYHVPKSRKKRYQNRRALTRSGTNIYHAQNLKAKTMKELLLMPGMRAKLANVRIQKPVYVSSSQADPNDAETAVIAAVPFPDYVKEISENIVTEGIKFVDAGDVDPCVCYGDCFAHVCRNADTAFYCAPDICRLEARCSNAPRTHPGLRIYDTRRLGMGVYTTEKLWAGEIIAESCGTLQEYEAMRGGQPEEVMRQNSGYTMLLNEKTRRGNFVYVEALAAGSIARFLQHAWRPNVEFVEMQNRTQVKVLRRMLSTVDIVAKITVSYGNEIWFKCACHSCWKEPLSQK